VLDAMQPTCRFVGMFDIIGFKALRATKGTAGLHQLFKRGVLPSILLHAAAGQGTVATVADRALYVPRFSETSVSFRVISDSVIFFTKDDSFSSFLNIVNSAFMLLQSGFNGSKAPYHGAIGHGDLIDDPDGVLLGSAIEDAYAGESSQAWAGVMLTEACRDHADSRGFIQQYTEFRLMAADIFVDDHAKRNARINARRLVEYSVPIHRSPKEGPATYGELRTYVIDWTIRMYKGAARTSFELSGSTHARTTAANTVAFEEWAGSRDDLGS